MKFTSHGSKIRVLLLLYAFTQIEKMQTLNKGTIFLLLNLFTIQRRTSLTILIALVFINMSKVTQRLHLLQQV